MSKGRILFGVVLILIGLTAILNSFQITDISFGRLIADYWPVLLILWGFEVLLEQNGSSAKVAGLLIFLIGVVFLGRNLHWFYFNTDLFWRLLWPAILILLGVRLLLGARFDARTNLAFMGGIERKDDWQVSNNNYWAFMGGIDLDLRKAVIPDQVTTFTVTAIMGGVDIIVPPDLAVVCEGTAILGGVELLGKSNGGILANLRAEQGDTKSPKLLRINSLAIMGGVEVKVVPQGVIMND